MISGSERKRYRPMRIVNADDADDTELHGMNMKMVIDSDDVVNGSMMIVRPNANSQEQMDSAHEIPLCTKHTESESQREGLPLSSERL